MIVGGVPREDTVGAVAAAPRATGVAVDRAIVFRGVGIVAGECVGSRRRIDPSKGLAVKDEW